jgi:hypothetical protein
MYGGALVHVLDRAGCGTFSLADFSGQLCEVELPASSRARQGTAQVHYRLDSLGTILAGISALLMFSVITDVVSLAGF